MPRQNPTRVPAHDRRIKALELRKAGATYQEIADALGFGNRANACRAVTQALTETIAEAAEPLRKLEVERLDKMLRSIWLKVTQGDVVAINTGLRIMERRAKLLGLDAPTQTIVDQVTEVRVVFADDIAPAPDSATE
jgi:hypothetical protein